MGSTWCWMGNSLVNDQELRTDEVPPPAPPPLLPFFFPLPPLFGPPVLSCFWRRKTTLPPDGWMAVVSLGPLLFNNIFEFQVAKKERKKRCVTEKRWLGRRYALFHCPTSVRLLCVPLKRCIEKERLCGGTIGQQLRRMSSIGQRGSSPLLLFKKRHCG